MQIEQLEILDFLRAHPPFDALPDEVLQRVAAAVDVRYYKAGEAIVEFGQVAEFWHVVRSGAVEVFRRNGTLYNRLTAGGYFGEFGLLRNGRVRFPVSALEDTLLYLIPRELFAELFDQHERFADLVEVEDRTRLRQVMSKREDANDLLSATVDTLIGRAAVTLPSTASARELAQRMTEEGVSSLLILDDNPEVPELPLLAGIVTDRDLRTRLVAPGLSYDTLAAEIMSRGVVAVSHTQLVFEAMLAMLRHNVHHLPVLKNQRPLGVIALSDIIRYESRNSLFVVGSIFRQQSVDELAALVPEVRACFARMVGEDASANMIGSAMAAIGRSFKQRLLELAEADLGPPPVPYCFLALGSMARQEQLIVTDQDNALVLDNRFDPAQHDAYFKALATFVSDGLARCGYSYCTGGVMATNEKWRQPVRVWEQLALSRLHGAQRAAAHAAARLLQGLRGRVRRPPHARDQHQAPRHRAARRPGAGACAGDRCTVDQLLRAPQGHHRRRRPAARAWPGPLRRPRVHLHGARPPPGRRPRRRRRSGQQHRPREAVRIRAQEPARRLPDPRQRAEIPQVPLPARAGELRRGSCCIWGI